MNDLKLIPVRQRLDIPASIDVGAELMRELDGGGVRFPPGARVAIAVGSRGIAGLVEAVRTLVAWLNSQGARPFIVPAMGSHGGATPQGQAQVLAGYGITAESAGAPIVSSMEVVELPRGDVEVPVYFDKTALSADATIVLNRVKPHTSFHGRYESGLMKMIAIGLGKHAQALAIHQLGLAGLREVMPRVAAQALRHANIVMGIAIVENARDEVMQVRVLEAARIAECEPAMLELARRQMPALPTDALDVLIVDEMGKNISGLGMDPNIIGRLRIRGEPEPDRPSIRMIIARDLAPGSHGNAIGVGLADVITRRLFDKIDFASTYENALTSTFLERARIPMIADDDRQALQWALRAAGITDPAQARIARITSTLCLEHLLLSATLVDEMRQSGLVEITGPAMDAMANRE